MRFDKADGPFLNFRRMNNLERSRYQTLALNRLIKAAHFYRLTFESFHEYKLIDYNFVGHKLIL
jgi:hypothetical protein